MSRLARAVREDDGETVMILGGEHGAVTLRVSLCGIPQEETLHSPRGFGGWDGPAPCRFTEMPCWELASVTAEEMANLLVKYSIDGAGSGEEGLWQMMEQAYRLYLAGDRR